MDHLPPSSPPPQAQQPGHREMVYCHLCHDEWFRDEHGLTCPECGSDFTEIIEDNNDPRDDPVFGGGHDHDHDHSEEDDDNDSMPPLEELPQHLQRHHPWQHAEDPDEADISGLQFRQLGPGRFAVTGSIYRTISPADIGRGGGGGGNGPNSVGAFTSLLNSIVGGIAGAQRQNPDERNQQGERDQDGSERRGRGEGTTPGGHRFTYTSTARLFPRDTDHPGPHMEPTDELNNVLVGLMAAFGEPPGGPHQHFRGFGDDDGNGRGFPHSPFMALFSQLGGGQFGDAVYSQEALDRIISQLMEQNATSNAPGPASQDLIDTLPRKPVTIEMLGAEGRAECSICMDEVNIGEEVAELPCRHWFHHACVAAWLGEHDTCPHCRKGITKQSENPNAPQSPTQGTNPSRAMPGAFAAGSPNSPHTPSSPQSPNNRPSSGDQAHPGSGGGFGDRIRRSWFGPPSN